MVFTFIVNSVFHSKLRLPEIGMSQHKMLPTRGNTISLFEIITVAQRRYSVVLYSRFTLEQTTQKQSGDLTMKRGPTSSISHSYRVAQRKVNFT